MAQELAKTEIEQYNKDEDRRVDIYGIDKDSETKLGVSFN